MYVDPSGHFITALLIGMGISALVCGIFSGVKAYLSGERGWDLVADVIGGTIFGAAVGAAIVLGGASGLASVGATVTGFGLSTGSALAVSVGATAIGGAVKYSFDCIASPDNNWNIGGFVLSTIEGALQGLSSFGIAFVGGKSGLFNKLSNFKTPDSFFIKHGGINTLRSVVWGTKVAIGETLAKTIWVSGISAISRFLIDMIIPDLY